MAIKDSSKRYERWLKKLQGYYQDRTRSKLSQATKIAAQTEFQHITQIERITKSILSQTTVPTHLNFYYLAYARELYGLSRRYQAKNLERELEILDYKWQRRGLDTGLLQTIRNSLLNYLQAKEHSSAADATGTGKRGRHSAEFL